MHIQEVREKLKRSQKLRLLNNPEKIRRGEKHPGFGKPSIFHQQSKKWQEKQRETCVNLRHSEQYFCELCSRKIKTTGNWKKHLQIKHNYTEDMWSSAKNENFGKVDLQSSITL